MYALMNIRNCTMLLACLLVLATIGYLLFLRKEAVQQNACIPSTPDSNAAVVMREIISVPRIVPSSDLIASTVQPDARPANITSDQWTAILADHQMNVEANNGAVEFYGRVVDQDGNGIAGVIFTVKISYYVEDIKEQMAYGGGKIGSKILVFKSDYSGSVVIKGHSGQFLVFDSIDCAGYRPTEIRRHPYFFSPLRRPEVHSAKSDSPVVFSLWKYRGHETITMKQFRRQVIPNGLAYAIDIRAGKVVESGLHGDVLIRLRAQEGDDSAPARFSWNVQIDTPTGGIIESEDEFMYFPPEIGYCKRYLWEQQSSANDWQGGIAKKFYFKLSEPLIYASLNLELIIPNPKKALIICTTYVNTSGNRSLECAPEKVINEP